ncbi:hypothetical protein AMECASPLE_030285, partial [Ameca splendens]
TDKKHRQRNSTIRNKLVLHSCGCVGSCSETFSRHLVGSEANMRVKQNTVTCQSLSLQRQGR